MIKDSALQREMLRLQQGEITGSIVYRNLAKRVKDEHNKAILLQMANEERSHYEVFKSYTGQDVKPSRFQIWFFTWISRLFGLTFGIKLLENQEDWNQTLYQKMEDHMKEIHAIIEDEERHENQLIGMLNEEGLSYMSSVVLGLNDALVELTGALAGFTLSLQHSRTIALLGLITGISASLSMAASEYLATKADDEGDDGKHPFKASVYTGSAYIVTVVLLVLPFWLMSSYLVALGASIGIAIAIIFVFNYYISVAKDYSFRRRFFGMAGVSLGVALISFLIGYAVRTFIGLEI
jgi:VIT1/CCC1 family predicted Fe2+/Mn2+ transporter